MATAGVAERAIAADIGCSEPTLRKHFADILKEAARPLSGPVVRAISLGAGVQSTAMVLMAAAGELKPMPDVALFADTHSEPRYVYEHLDWMRSLALPFPVKVIDGGDLRGDLEAGNYGRAFGSYPAIPYFLDTTQPGGGRGVRGCTGPYKIRPLAREHRRMLNDRRAGRLRAGSVEVWIGISTDEAHRMKPAQNAWQVNRFPLIEAGLSRSDCIGWLTGRGYRVPERSACTFCPYRSDHEWRRLKELDEDGWWGAVRMDEALRDNKTKLGLSADPYLHRSRKPLSEVILDHPTMGDLFGEECSGLCGA